ncbi:MAG: MMPL family transporter, partial [Methanomassiliicoccaceae archaeon]|nr:MMPL family transporter [Methanomassiliicoccaceae archaeon]
KGCMVSVILLDKNIISDMKDGQLGFEKDVIGTAKGFITENDGLSIRAIGMMTMMSEIGELAQNDIMMLLPIALAVIVILLLLIYRDLADTLVGLLGLLIAIVWTFGIAALINIQMSTIAIAVPILILALGIDYSLHLVFRYREERGSGEAPSGAISKTMGSVGIALVLATVTTAIAFLSYQTSSLSALADFGLMCAIGIVCAFGSMLLLIPAAQILRDRKAERKGKTVDDIKRYRKPKNENGDVLSKISGVGGRMAAKSPWAVLGVVAVLMALFGYSATNLSYSFNMYDFIPEGTEASDVLSYMEDNYANSTSVTSVLIYDSGWRIEVIQAIQESLDNMSAEAESDRIKGLAYRSPVPPDTTHTVVADHIGTALHSLYTALKLKAEAVPADPDDIAAFTAYAHYYGQLFDLNTGVLIGTDQNALTALRDLVEGSGMDAMPAISSVVGTYNGERVTRISLSMTTEVDGDNNAILSMKDAIDAASKPISDLAEARYITTGQAINMSSTMEEMNSSQMTALFITILLVMIILTAFMYYVDRSWLLGTLATIPTLISVIMVWGTMAVLNIPLNVMTLTIASLAVGMGVTYGIHISHRYVTELVNNDLDAKEAIKKATRETGKGVFAAALTTVAGFGVMVFSKILPMYQFGVITALAIGFGYIGSVFVLPSLLVIWGKRAKPGMMDRRNGIKREKVSNPAFDRFKLSDKEIPPKVRKEHPEWDGYKL